MGKLTAGQKADRPQVRETISLRRMRGAGLQRLKTAERVLIQSDGGFWRANAAGYTNFATAAVYTGEDAYNRTWHCGSEKSVRYHVLRANVEWPPNDRSRLIRQLLDGIDAAKQMAVVSYEIDACVLKADLRELRRREARLGRQVDAAIAAGRAALTGGDNGSG